MALAIAIVSVFVAAASALASILYARKQVRLATRQLELSKRVRREQAEPYVVVDIRPSKDVSEAFVLVIENIGPTVARDVRITCDPPLERTMDDPDLTLRESYIFTEGIPTMPPGWRMELWFDMVHNRVISSLPTAYTIKVDADGPFGPVETMTYKIDLGVYTGIATLTVHGMHDAAKSLESIARAIERK